MSNDALVVGISSYSYSKLGVLTASAIYSEAITSQFLTLAIASAIIFSTS